MNLHLYTIREGEEIPDSVINAAMSNRPGVVLHTEHFTRMSNPPVEGLHIWIGGDEDDDSEHAPH